MSELTPYLEFLDEELLPKLMTTYGVGLHRPFRLWCVDCPQGAMPLKFSSELIRFRQRSPAFTFRLHVSDSSSDKIARARQVFDQQRADAAPQGWVTFEQSRCAPPRLTLWKPQDAISCFHNLEQMEDSDRSQLLADFSRMLFPGRILMGPRLAISSSDDVPFEQVQPGIYRRTP